MVCVVVLILVNRRIYMKDNDNVEEIIIQNFTLILFDWIILYIKNSKIR